VSHLPTVIVSALKSRFDGDVNDDNRVIGGYDSVAQDYGPFQDFLVVFCYHDASNVAGYVLESGFGSDVKSARADLHLERGLKTFHDDVCGLYRNHDGAYEVYPNGDHVHDVSSISCLYPFL
jgi:hypothetical protein